MGAEMRWGLVLVAMSSVGVSGICYGQTTEGQPTIYITVEGDDVNRVSQLAEGLIEHGQKEGVLFAIARRDQREAAVLRVVLKTGKSMSEAGHAAAVVLTPDCHVVTAIGRSKRQTVSGATNAVTKEVAKQILAYVRMEGLDQLPAR